MQALKLRKENCVFYTSKAELANVSLFFPITAGRCRIGNFIRKQKTWNLFLHLNKELLGIERYNILSNFEKWGIQHIDCYMKLLDEERIVVIEPPKNHELFQVYENIIENEIKKLKNPYGRPYEIIRIKTERYDEDRLAAYTNSLIVNKTIYVPLFNIEGDSVALRTWQQVMPGYTIKGFGFKLTDEPVISQKILK